MSLPTHEQGAPLVYFVPRFLSSESRSFPHKDLVHVLLYLYASISFRGGADVNNMFLISKSTYSLLACPKWIDFWTLIALYLQPLVLGFSLILPDFFTWTVMSSANKRSFNSFFPTCTPFHFLVLSSSLGLPVPCQKAVVRGVTPASFVTLLGPSSLSLRSMAEPWASYTCSYRAEEVALRLAYREHLSCQMPFPHLSI